MSYGKKFQIKVVACEVAGKFRHDDVFRNSIRYRDICIGNHLEERKYRSYVLFEPHVDHPIRLVHAQVPANVQPDHFLIQHIHEPPRSRHHDVNAPEINKKRFEFRPGASPPDANLCMISIDSLTGTPPMARQLRMSGCPIFFKLSE